MITQWMIERPIGIRAAGRRLAVAVRVALILSAASSATFAQSGGGYVIKKSTIDGGGYTFHSGGTSRLGGTAGQHDAASVSGGAYALTGGFWSPPAAGPPPCLIAAAAELAQQDSNAGPGVNPVDLRMNRYIGIRAPGSAGLSQAIRVEFVDLPPPWGIWNGTKLYLTAPTTQCEVAAVGRNQACPAGAPTFQMAGLTCNPDNAHYRDWSTIDGGVVYITHPGIVPVPIPGGPPATYEIKVIDEACDSSLEASYSAGKTVQQVRWGDLAGPFDPTGNYYTAPEGTSTSVSITIDITAALNKFGNRSGAPIKARADVEPCLADLRMNITDVSRLLDAFRGVAYPFAPGQAAFGCGSMDACSYTMSADMAGGE
jgi:hypothetical protein